MENKIIKTLADLNTKPHFKVVEAKNLETALRNTAHHTQLCEHPFTHNMYVNFWKRTNKLEILCRKVDSRLKPRLQKAAEKGTKQGKCSGKLILEVEGTINKN